MNCLIKLRVIDTQINKTKKMYKKTKDYAYRIKLNGLIAEQSKIIDTGIEI